MSKPAILGGKPVVTRLTAGLRVGLNHELERKYLLDAFDTGVWDDWRQPGAQATLFRKEFARFQTAKYCVPVTNGTHTLQLALEALGIGFGDEVIVPGMTWQATASAVVDVNAVPVLVDIDPETFCIDVEKIERAITRRTRAIIPVHLYARCADMDRVLQIARKHKLRVVEDCAHSHGSRFDGKGVGSLGDAGSFSFQRSKLITGGEGGAVTTNDEDLCRKIESMRICGREVEGVSMHSGNYRMTCFQAGVLRGQLDWLKSAAPVMDRFSRALDKAVAKAPGVAPLRRNPKITRQCGYGVGFRYLPEAWDGMPGEVFRKALARETGLWLHGGYEPLNDSPLYRPHTKKRTAISKEHLAAIDPARWVLPVAWEVFRNTAVLAHWDVSLLPPARLGLLTDAIGKLYEYRKELAANARRILKQG